MDPFVREKDQKLLAWVGELADQIAPIGVQADRDGQFASKQIEILQQAGYTALTVPKEFGGHGATLYQMLLAQECLAEGDPSSALVLGWHLGITLSLHDTKAWPDELYADLCRKAVNGKALVNSCASEPITGSPSRGGRPSTTATPVEGGYRITGKKTWSTGSQMLSHIMVTAYIKDLDRIGEFLVLAGSPGLSIDETWDSIAMRGTGSHTLVLQDVFVPTERALDIVAVGQRTKRSSDGGGWMLHIPATYLGIANAARKYAINYAVTYAPNSLDKPISSVPHVRDKIGRMEVLRQTARTLLYDTARRYEEAQPDVRMQMRPDLGLAKYVATNAAVQIVDLAMRIVGGNSLLQTTPLERYYRDVRAGLHNPPMDDNTLHQLTERAIREAEK